MTKNPNKQPVSAGFKAIAFGAVVLLLLAAITLLASAILRKRHLGKEDEHALS